MNFSFKSHSISCIHIALLSSLNTTLQELYICTVLLNCSNARLSFLIMSSSMLSSKTNLFHIRSSQANIQLLSASAWLFLPSIRFVILYYFIEVEVDTCSALPQNMPHDDEVSRPPPVAAMVPNPHHSKATATKKSAPTRQK